MKKIFENITKLKEDPSITIENGLLKISILGMLSLVFVQFFMSNDSISPIIGGSNHELVALEESTLNKKVGWVEIKIENFSKYKNLTIFKNGINVEDVIAVEDIINIQIEDGDVIEIDATDYEESIEITVSDVSSNLENVEIGEKYQSKQNIVYLFKTQLSIDNNS